MNFLDLAKERYSCRSFEEKEIEKEKEEIDIKLKNIDKNIKSYKK